MIVLQRVKKIALGSTDDSGFDVELLQYINATLAILHGLGVSQFDGYTVTSETDWPDFTGNEKLGLLCIAYLGFRVKEQFDPQANATVAQSIQRLADETEQGIQLLVHEAEAAAV